MIDKSLIGVEIIFGEIRVYLLNNVFGADDNGLVWLVNK